MTQSWRLLQVPQSSCTLSNQSVYPILQCAGSVTCARASSRDHGFWTEPAPRDLRQHCGLYGLSDQRRRSNHAQPYSLCRFSICTNHAQPYSLCCFSTYTRCLNRVRAAVLKWGVDRCTASFSDLITAAVDEDATRQRQNLAVSGDFHSWNDQRGVDRTRSVRQEHSIRRSQQYDLKHGY